MNEVPYVRDILSQPEALESAVRAFDAAPLKDIAAQLKAGQYDRVVITGMGASYHSGYPAWLMLSRGPLPAIWVDTAELIHHARQPGDPAHAAVDDVAIRPLGGDHRRAGGRPADPTRDADRHGQRPAKPAGCGRRGLHTHARRAGGHRLDAHLREHAGARATGRHRAAGRGCRVGAPRPAGHGRGHEDVPRGLGGAEAAAGGRDRLPPAPGAAGARAHRCAARSRARWC